MIFVIVLIILLTRLQYNKVNPAIGLTKLGFTDGGISQFRKLFNPRAQKIHLLTVYCKIFTRRRRHS